MSELDDDDDDGKNERQEHRKEGGRKKRNGGQVAITMMTMRMGLHPKAISYGMRVGSQVS